MSTLTDSSQDHLGWVYPLPPQTELTLTEAFVGVVSGTAVLVEDQDYIDVVFGTEQSNEDWVLLECVVINEIDGEDALNLWAGIITEKTTAGFRVYLNGLPDSGNYYLSWSIRGVFGYYLSGPASGEVGEASTDFTVRLPDESTMTGTVVITPDDGAATGTFTPSTIELTLEDPSGTFTYTPSSYGARNISTTNDRGLINPAQIGYAVTTPTYTFTGPSTGVSGVASTNFTVTLSGSVVGTVTVTPSDGGDGGIFTPTTATLTTGAPVDTFTYTPASEGTKTISVTNNVGLTNPANLSYIATEPAFDPSSVAGLVLWLKADSLVLSDGDPVSTWEDSSSAGNDATQSSTARPIYKTSIVNSLPVVRFDGSNDFMQLGTAITITSVCNVFVVHQTSGDCCLVGGVTAASNYQTLRVGRSAANVLSYNTPGDGETVGSTLSVARTSWNTAIVRRDGSNVGLFDSAGAAGGGVATSTIELRAIGALASMSALYTTGDIAEVLVYNTAISVSDFNDVHDFLKDKYGIA